MIHDISAEPIEIWHAEEYSIRNFVHITISTSDPYHYDLSAIDGQVLYAVYCKDGVVLWTIKEQKSE